MKINIKKHKNKFIIIFSIILILYIILLTNIKRLETLATFPGIAVNVQDVVGYVKSNPEFEEINITLENGNNINGLYLGVGTGKTVYYFHGNGGPLHYFYSEIEYIKSLGYNVMAYDYPGYGKSTGFPYKENVEQYSKEFFNYIKKEKNFKDDEIIIWGYSVGTAVASDFASKNNFEKIILISPLSSRYDMSDKYFGFPLQKILFRENSFITKDLVKDFAQPGLIIHGNKDNIVPYSQGQKVFENYGKNNGKEKNKYFIEIDGFSHNYIINVYGKALEYKIREFLSEGKISGNKNTYLLNDKTKILWEQETEKWSKIFGADLKNDTSLTKFVTSWVPFNDKGYLPENLVRFSSEYVADGKENGKLRADIIPNVNALGKAFKEEFGKKLQINSSYRSYFYQKGIKDRGCPDNLCAKAGYSEHQSGLAFDIFSISNQQTWENNTILSNYYSWLERNAHKYGFTNTYQKGLKIDGYDIEPWHWRYVGEELATHLSENKITIAEFYISQQ